MQEICGNFGKLKMCRINWDRMGRSKVPFGKYKETASVEFFYLEDEDRAYK